MAKLEPRGRKVKILATIGPASSDPDMLRRLWRAGADASTTTAFVEALIAACAQPTSGTSSPATTSVSQSTSLKPSTSIA